MYYKTNQTCEELSLAGILSATQRQQYDGNSFPYTKEICRCRYCLYCKNGKCALQYCCCMPERIRAHTCTVSEVMNNCFENIRDHVFRFRLRLTVERTAQLHTCFLDREHKKRFYEGLSRSRRKDNSFTAQTFLLSASKDLWSRADDVFRSGGYIYDYMELGGISESDYTLYCAAVDLQCGGSHCDIADLTLNL